MNVLVTGGAGFIGSHLVKRLISEGESVTVLDNLSTGRRENLNSLTTDDHFQLVVGDIRDREVLRRCVANADRVVHLAAIASVPYSIRNPVETHDVNVTGTLNVLQACAEHGVGKLVYASSCAVYGEPTSIPISEEHQFSATSPYAQSKIEAESYCQLFRDRRDLQTICLRAFNVYGANQHNSDYGGVITQFLSRLRDQRPPLIYGDGEQSRDFVHVNDVVEMMAKILLSANGANGTYNIGSGVATTVNHIAKIIQRYAGDDQFRPIHVPARLADIRQIQADIGKAGRELGFSPSTSLDDGLKALMSSETRLSIAPVTRHIAKSSKVGNAEE